MRNPKILFVFLNDYHDGKNRKYTIHIGENTTQFLPLMTKIMSYIDLVSDFTFRYEV